MSDDLDQAGTTSFETPPHTLLTLTTRNDFSLLAKSIQRLIKPFKPRLVSPPRTPFAVGSPPISPLPDALTRKCRVDERRIKDIWTYTLTSKALDTEAPKPTHHIYYFHGGGFQNHPSNDHYKLLAELSRRLGEQGGESQLHMVSYPLAPANPAGTSLAMLRTWLEEVLKQAAEDGSTVALAGDSSGGNLAITLALAACGAWQGSFDARENAVPGPLFESTSDASSKDTLLQDLAGPLTSGCSANVHILTNVLAMCPATDMRNDNPEMQSIDRVDPILTSQFTGMVAKIWCGSMNLTAHPSAVRALSVRKPQDRAAQLENTDPRVSPVLADLRRLAEQGVRMDGLIGGHDVLSADAKVFYEKLRVAGASGEWQLWHHMMHCWFLTWWAHQKESLETVDWIVRRLSAKERP